MSVFGVRTGRERNGFVACSESAIEPSKESVNVYRTDRKNQFRSTGRKKEERSIQSFRVAVSLKLAMNLSCSFVTVRRSKVYRSRNTCQHEMKPNSERERTYSEFARVGNDSFEIDGINEVL